MFANKFLNAYILPMIVKPLKISKELKTELETFLTELETIII